MINTSMNQNKLIELLGLFVDGGISREEYDLLFDYIRANLEDEELHIAIDAVFKNSKKFNSLNSDDKELFFQNIIRNKHFDSEIDDEIEIVSSFAPRLWYQLGIAVSILILITTGLYFYKNRTADDKIAIKIIEPKEAIITPGYDKAILTLSDGTEIILEDAKNGILANQAGVSIQKTSDGELLYSFSNSANTVTPKTKENVIYNKIETPIGGKYQVNLPDGSKVWLNSSSSLRFSALFNGDAREVELSGEAYFDVSKNKSKPFRVITKDQIVEVLGTQFNINSYSDEGPIKTTLIEGSVKIIYKDKVVLLSPGQQFQPKELVAAVVEADTEEVVAWKDGYFVFKNEDIRSIMRKLSRWYNVEVSYSGNIPEVGFGGNISRSKDISEVLDVLQLTNAIHFKVEGRRITVMR
jgi:transmembrane sensor|uniref:FecR family protein n=1 Tax=Daejeonella sp. TaxID=2805397 RepID=UPI00404AF7F4